MRRAAIALACLVTASAAYGLQVDKAELSKGQNANIHFVNYVGPHTVVNTIREIVGIGRSMGKTVDPAKPGEFSYHGLYRVIHAVGSGDPAKLDADLFIIEPGATVDDITNVRRMVSGYLEAAYSYSPQDAATLAKFVVYYNAVYRGKMKYLDATYKTIVTKHLSAQDAGIARVYSQWPGKTRMVIPLTSEAGKGTLGSVGAGQLTSPKVVQNLQKQPNKGISSRKAITDLQQRSIVQDQKKVNAQKAQIAQAQKKIAQAQKKIQQEQTKVAQQQKSAKTPQQKQAAAAASAAIQSQQKAVAQQQKQVAQQQQTVATQQKQLAQRQKTLQKQRQSIASDQRTLLKQQQPPAAGAKTAAPKTASAKQGQTTATQSAPATPASGTTTTTTAPAKPGKVVFVYDQPGGADHLGRLVIIDRVSGKLLASSQLNTIRGRRYERLASEFVVIAGKAGGNGAVRLVALGATGLKMSAQSTAAIAPSSALAASGSSIYAVAETKGKPHLARFTTALKEAAVSAAVVNPYTDITVSGNEVYVQDSTGNILILDKTDLKEKRRSGG